LITTFNQIKGLIDQKKLDTFKLPIYVAYAGEIKQIIEDNVYYTIERFDIISQENEEIPLDPEFLTVSFKVTVGEL